MGIVVVLVVFSLSLSLSPRFEWPHIKERGKKEKKKKTLKFSLDSPSGDQTIQYSREREIERKRLQNIRTPVHISPSGTLRERRVRRNK